MRRPRILLVAAGGGHTGYAVATAEELAGHAELGFIVGEGDYWSLVLVKKYGRIAIARRLRGPSESLAKAVSRLGASLPPEARQMVGWADLVVSTGSNLSLTVSLYALVKGKQVLNMEAADRLASRSRSTLLLSLAPKTITVLHWREQLKLYRHAWRVAVVGPVYEKPRYKPRDEGYVLACCGTHGNRALLEALAELGVSNVVAQIGKTPNPPTKPGWRVFRFTTDLHYWISRASIVVTHPGKTVIDAALAYHKPVIIVVNPEWKLTSTPRDAEKLARLLNAVYSGPPTPKRLQKALKLAERKRPPRIPSGAPRLARLALKLANHTS